MGDYLRSATFPLAFATDSHADFVAVVANKSTSFGIFRDSRNQPGKLVLQGWVFFLPIA